MTAHALASRRSPIARKRVSRLAPMAAVALLLISAAPAMAQVHRRAPDLYVVAMSYEPSRTFQCTDARGAPQGKSEVTLSPDGAVLASATTRQICLFDVFSGKRFKTLSVPSLEYTEGVEEGGNWGLTYSPDGTMLAVFTDRFREHGERGILLWDVELEAITQRLVIGQGLRDWVSAISFSGDGRLIATAGADGRARVWDAETGRVVRIWSAEFPARAVALSPDGQVVAVGGDDTIVRLYDIASGDLVGSFEGHEGRINSLAFSPDGRLLASSSSDGTIKIWHVQLRKYVRTIDGMATSLAFAPDGKLLATAAGGAFRLWDTEYGEIARTLVVDSSEPDAFRCMRVAYSADGRTIACSDESGVARLWRTELIVAPDFGARAAVVGVARDSTSKTPERSSP
jgi:WD40 repeat protein